MSNVIHRVIYKDGHSEKCPICGFGLTFHRESCKCLKCGNEFSVVNYDDYSDRYQVKDCSSGKKTDKRNRV